MTHSAPTADRPAFFVILSHRYTSLGQNCETGRDSHSILLQICGQQITATDMGQICDSEFLATDLRAELAVWPKLRVLVRVMLSGCESTPRSQEHGQEVATARGYVRVKLSSQVSAALDRYVHVFAHSTLQKDDQRAASATASLHICSTSKTAQRVALGFPLAWKGGPTTHVQLQGPVECSCRDESDVHSRERRRQTRVSCGAVLCARAICTW